MFETELVIEFECYHCQGSINAHLKCAGKGVSEGPHAVARVFLPCPTCDQVNKVCFELSGLILAVDPERKSKVLLEPSLN